MLNLQCENICVLKAKIFTKGHDPHTPVKWSKERIDLSGHKGIHRKFVFYYLLSRGPHTFKL